MTTSMINETQSNLDIQQFVEKLQGFQEIKRDIVVPSELIKMQETNIILPQDNTSGGFSDLFANSGISRPDLIVSPNHLMHRQLGSRLQIPATYYDRMKVTHPELLAENVNTWLKSFNKNVLVRMYDNGEATSGRAFLSDKFKTLENLDIVMAVLEVVMNSGLKVIPETADISENRIYLRFVCPEVKKSAPELLRNYRNPDTKDINDGVMSGFVVRNSEVGQGAFEIMPRAVMLVCKNGMIGERDQGYRRTHVGAKMDQGEIDWSSESKELNSSLIKSQIKDVVKHFASHEYLGSFLEKLGAYSGQKLEHPADATVNAASHLGLGKEAQDKVLSYFINGGDTSALGVSHALTFYAHEQDNPDVRDTLEAGAFQVLPKIGSLDRKIANN